MWVLLRQLGATDRLAGFGCLLFIVSFPTFYYGTIGYVDPLAIALMFGVLAAWWRRRMSSPWPDGARPVTRESTVIIVVVAVDLAVDVRNPPRARSSDGECSGRPASCNGRPRSYRAPGRGHQRVGAIARPRLSNARRPRTWLSAALTLGMPAVLRWCTPSTFARLDRQHRAHHRGDVLSWALFAYALAAAYADGRFLWPMYAFTIPGGSSARSGRAHRHRG